MSRKKNASSRSSATALRRKLDKQAADFLAAYQKRDFATALQAAESLKRDFPYAAFSWKAMGTCLLESGDAEQALPQLEHALELVPDDVEVLTNTGKVLQKLGRYDQAKVHLEKALTIQPDNHQANLALAHGYSRHEDNQVAIEYLDKSIQATPNNPLPRMRKATALVEQRDYDAALAILEKLVQTHPRDPGVRSNLANLYSTMGRFEEAEKHYWRAVELSPNTSLPYSNYYFTAHYNPAHSQQNCLSIALDWQRRYGPMPRPERPLKDKCPSKVLKIGLVSAGLRTHPVGQMIVAALEQCSQSQFSFYAYSEKFANDSIAKRIERCVVAWHDVAHLSHTALYEKIKADEIDILIDLTGHTSGNRLAVMAMEPAPVIIKWVGGLFNTVGLDAIDYLISDHVETPSGVDDQYLEKLIRMPDDYICYLPTRHAPSSISKLPALDNGYITLACFNNPAKLNEVLLGEWAKLMHQLPNSRLFLKGGQFTNELYCERIYEFLESCYISRERILLEGPSSHVDLLKAYERVDVALDPWPYSGGLTTCEALMMGVPVVTLPGPTFAGRHSATHLVNAGLPELVTGSWNEYRQRVQELASDLNNLSIIRQGLRQQLLDSPVCDAPRFAKHFTTAMRAIWQRHCEDKAPEALTFNKVGQAWFADDETPVAVQYAPEKKGEENFYWELNSKIITIDNGGKLLTQGNIQELRQLNAFGIVSFDSASQADNPAQFQGSEDVQVFPHASLGSGEPATLYACLDAKYSSTLEPLPPEQQHGTNPQGAKVLTKLPVNTIALDSIEGLESLDWLILDDLSDANAILGHGEKALRDTLAIQVRIAFQPTHLRQPNFAEIQHWMARHGFRFYRLSDPQHLSHLPEGVSAEKRQATELQSVDALFLPSHDRQAQLTDNQRTKLAFLLHTVYGIKDMAYKLLKDLNEDKAEKYLAEQSLLFFNSEETGETPQSENEEPSETTNSTQEFSLPHAPHMSPEERKLFKISLGKANQYFEFGSGGSTVWAIAEGLTAKGVESDAKWVDALKDKLGEKCQVEAVDVGPTKEWGFPVSMQQASKFPAYSKAIHQHPQAFDLILVDGRFRVACTMAAIQHILEHSKEPEKARIFIHDFWNRPHYHVVLPFLETVEKAESAALFKIAKNVERNKVADLWEKYAKQPQ